MLQWKNKASERSQDNKCKKMTYLCVIMCNYLQEGPRGNSSKFINMNLLDPGNDSGEEFLPHVSCIEVGRCRFQKADNKTTQEHQGAQNVHFFRAQLAFGTVFRFLAVGLDIHRAGYCRNYALKCI